MPADERLAQPHVLDQLGHRGRPVGQALDDPKPVHVGQGLVKEADLAELVRLIDHRGDRRADSSGGWAQGGTPGAVALAADRWADRPARPERLNAYLYKVLLILGARGGLCQAPALRPVPAWQARQRFGARRAAPLDKSSFQSGL